MNNRIQGQTGEMSNRERGTVRAREYVRLLGEQPPGMGNGGMEKYCLVHDATTHTTDQCYYLNQYRESMKMRAQQDTGEYQHQGNRQAGPFPPRN